MSSFNDTLKKRRSIRRYTHQLVPLELVKELLQAAAYAPSAHNAQPWRFLVLIGQEQKDALAKAMAEVWLSELESNHIPTSSCWSTAKASAERFTAAPALILACLTMEDMDVYSDEERQKNERDLAVQSLGAAIQNILLEAHVQGLGACWYCAPIFCKSAVRGVLKIPEKVEPQALIAIGYPAETPKMPPRNAVEDFSYLNEWESFLQIKPRSSPNE